MSPKTSSFSVDGLLSHLATQHWNLGITWSLHSPLVSTSKQSPSSILFLLILSPSVYPSPFPWPATALVQVLIISYFDFCPLITDHTVSLTLGLHLSNPFSIWQPDPSPPCFKFSGSPLQSRWNQMPYNGLQGPFWSSLCILSRIMSQSDSTHTNNSPLSLWHHPSATIVSHSLQPAIWSVCCSMNMPVSFTSGTFHLAFFLPGKFFHSRESQGLFPSCL